jgi:hypothetical protein
MKKVILLRQYLDHAPGEVVEVRDWDAVLLIRQGRAKYLDDKTAEKVEEKSVKKADPKVKQGKKPKK